MSFRKLLLFVMLCGLFSMSPGCGGATDGVADAPDEPEPELTAEEEAGEQEYTNSSEYRGQ